MYVDTQIFEESPYGYGAMQSTYTLCSRSTHWPCRADALDPYCFVFPVDTGTSPMQSAYFTLYLISYTYPPRSFQCARFQRQLGRDGHYPAR